MADSGSGTNKFWNVYYKVTESSVGSNTGTPSFGNVNQHFGFTGLVSFTSLSNSQSTTTIINGDNITTGTIASANYVFNSGTGFSNAGTAISLTNGVIISKNFKILSNGNAYFNGNITASSGTIGGWTLGSSGLRNGRSSMTSLTSGTFIGQAGIALGSTGAPKFKVTSGGVLTAISGTVGGWTLSTNKFTSSGGNIVLSSDTSSLPSLFITSAPGISGVPGTGTGAFSKSFSSSTYTGSSNAFITHSGGVVSRSYSYGNTAGLLAYDVYFTANSSVSGVPVTFNVTMSDNQHYNYILRVDAVSNRTFSGTIDAYFGYQLWDTSSGSTIVYFEKRIGGTDTYATNSSGNIDFSFNNIDVDGTLPSGTTLVDGRQYYLRRWLKEVRVQGQWSSATSYTVRFSLPEIRSASIIYAVGRTDIFAGGLQVVKNSGAFVSLNRNSTNTSSSPFILSSGFIKHSGNINIDGELEASVKNFKISHPKKSKSDTHYLLHCSVESPRADLIYRGKVNICQEVTSINIDDSSKMTEGTFISLCRNIQCFVSNETSWNPVKAKVVGNLLIITAKETGCFDTISWMVVGERKDISIYNSKATDDNGKLIVELEK